MSWKEKLKSICDIKLSRFFVRIKIKLSMVKTVVFKIIKKDSILFSEMCDNFYTRLRKNSWFWSRKNRNRKNSHTKFHAFFCVDIKCKMPKEFRKPFWWEFPLEILTRVNINKCLSWSERRSWSQKWKQTSQNEAKKPRINWRKLSSHCQWTWNLCHNRVQPRLETTRSIIFHRFASSMTAYVRMSVEHKIA